MQILTCPNWMPINVRIVFCKIIVYLQFVSVSLPLTSLRRFFFYVSIVCSFSWTIVSLLVSAVNFKPIFIRLCWLLHPHWHHCSIKKSFLLLDQILKSRKKQICCFLFLASSSLPKWSWCFIISLTDLILTAVLYRTRSILNPILRYVECLLVMLLT